VIAAHSIQGDGQAQILLAFVGDNLATAVVTVGSHVVATVNLTGAFVDGQSRPGQGVVCTTHTTPGRTLFVLLNSHGLTPVSLQKGHVAKKLLLAF
jgi:hypothetical protein